MTSRTIPATACILLASLAWSPHARAGASGEESYEHLSRLAREKGHGLIIFDRLEETSETIDWGKAGDRTFTGNLRELDVSRAGETGSRSFHLVREESGAIFVLDMPDDPTELEKGSASPYAGLKGIVGKKATYRVKASPATVDGVEYVFVRLEAPPERLLLDRLFFIAIIILLFLTMVGMGMTLTPKDFALVFKKPLGMIVGPVCQFGLLPVLAMLIGRVAGYYETYPFIFLGLILIASSPGGVTSNLMTYLGKGDVALSVSLTAVCTVLALLFTPLLLSLYGGNIPDFSIPYVDVFKQMLILVIVPLFVGMTIRWRAEAFAKKAEKVFAGIGIFALLFLIVVGILGNLDKFADTSRYGFKFYAIVFTLTFAGMIVSGLVAKALRITNYQIRAISLECGLRNASLAMTIAILLQDRMGDFYSSMLFTSGIFGLWMYVAGALTIFIFPKWLPVPKKAGEEKKK
jgi:BASS family bile acid:Na+ symporter